ncbi:MAG: isochorismate synthase [Cyclobacteriaceae bacterium]
MNHHNHDILTSTLSDPIKLTRELVGTGYSFAVWNLPNQETFSIAIDIHEHPLTNRTIDELESVFAVNQFANSHPPKPTFIRSDIFIQVANNDVVEIKVDPRISSTLIDVFLVNRKKKTPLKKIKKSSVHFENSVEKAIRNIHTGSFEKVVLSRFKDIKIKDSFDHFEFFNSLIKNYPNAFNYLLYTPQNGLWIGATPERLIDIDFNKGQFSTDALAGTQPLNGRALSEVAWTMKEIEEQAMVSRYIVDGFKKIRLREFDELGPKTVKAGNLAHLKTQFVVDMNQTNTPDLDKIMLELLHPTSAVCGFPRKAALDFINENENYDRELFAGFLGPVKINNATNIFVNLRCMQVFQDGIRLYAGAGITADSIPSKEYEETEQKMNTLLSLLQST